MPAASAYYTFHCIKKTVTAAVFLELNVNKVDDKLNFRSIILVQNFFCKCFRSTNDIIQDLRSRQKYKRLTFRI